MVQLCCFITMASISSEISGAMTSEVVGYEATNNR